MLEHIDVADLAREKDQFVGVPTADVGTQLLEVPRVRRWLGKMEEISEQIGGVPAVSWGFPQGGIPKMVSLEWEILVNPVDMDDFNASSGKPQI